MPVSPKTMRMVLERSGRAMPDQDLGSTAPRGVPRAPVRPPMPAQAAAPAPAPAPVMPPQAAPAMPPQGLPPQAAATLPPQAMGGAMPPQGTPPQGMPAQAQGMPPRGPMMKRGGSVKASSKPASKPASKPRGVGIAQRGFGCGGKVKMR